MEGGRKEGGDTELVLLLMEATITESVSDAGPVVLGWQDLQTQAHESNGCRSYKERKELAVKETTD